MILAEDLSEGVVYQKGGVKITAFEVDHTPVKPAFGYRIDHASRSVVRCSPETLVYLRISSTMPEVWTC